MLPAILLLTLTIASPLIRSIYTSLLDASLLSAERPWNGIANYKTLLTSAAFYHSLKVTLMYVFCVVGTELLLGMVAALLLNSPIRLRTFFRSILLIPWAIPTLVTALIFMLIYQGDYGVLNYLLLQTGIIDHKINVLNTASLALPAIMVAAIWRQTPLVSIMILAGLQGIPRSLYEAAMIDGAKKSQTFWHITIPSLSPVLANVTLMMIVANFQMFTLFFTLTGGGPIDATESLAIHTYKTAFQNYDLGQGAAIGVLCMILLILVAVPLHRVAHRNV